MKYVQMKCIGLYSLYWHHHHCSARKRKSEHPSFKTAPVLSIKNIPTLLLLRHHHHPFSPTYLRDTSSTFTICCVCTYITYFSPFTIRILIHSHHASKSATSSTTQSKQAKREEDGFNLFTCYVFSRTNQIAKGGRLPLPKEVRI